MGSSNIRFVTAEEAAAAFAGAWQIATPAPQGSEAAEIRLSQARRHWEKTIEAILLLTPADGIHGIQQAHERARAAWHDLDGALQGLVKARQAELFGEEK